MAGEAACQVHGRCHAPVHGAHHAGDRTGFLFCPRIIALLKQLFHAGPVDAAHDEKNPPEADQEQHDGEHAHKKKPIFREERAAEQRNGRKDTQAGAQNIVPRVGAAVLTLAFPHHAGYTVFRFKHFGLQIGIRARHAAAGDEHRHSNCDEQEHHDHPRAAGQIFTDGQHARLAGGSQQEQAAGGEDA